LPGVDSASDALPPGVTLDEPRRLRPRFHYELLVCGVAGHELLGADCREVGPEDALFAREIDGVRWCRCLRCDSWLPLEPGAVPITRDRPPPRDDVHLPLRGKPLRDRIILRLIAINRALHFLVLGLIGTLILVFSANRADLHRTVYRVIADLQGGAVSGSGAHKTGLLGEVDKAFSLQSSRLHLFGAVILAYALVEGVEAIGLWYQRRWAEYLTFLVTASLLPLEVYEIAHKLSPFKILAFVVNVAVVVYLLLAKRLFGIRGGAAADEAEAERDVGWQALERSLPSARPAA
jgi:uncharacterized membrane protein (DUF2068 family)